MTQDNGSNPAPDDERTGSAQLLTLSADTLRSLESDPATLLERARFASRYNLTFGGKRNLDEALGYAPKLDIKLYKQRYERGGIAERLAEAYPRATWAGGASIVEDPDPDVLTAFEEAAVELFSRLGVWSRIMRADILSGLGEFGVLLIGAKGNLNEELPKNLGAEGILYLTPLGEDRVKIKDLDEDAASVRYGLPTAYTVKLDDKRNTSVVVHWSRVIHIAEGLLDNDVYGKPRLRAVWNYLDDLEKVVGGGAEAAWNRMDPGFHADLDPQVALTPEHKERLKVQIEEFQHKLRRFITTRGMKINPLSGEVTAFGTNADSILDLIAGTTGIPQRVFVGSERGELASAQDRDNWADRIAERRREFAIPLVASFVDRLVEYGALPKPAEFEVVWPNEDEMNEEQKANVAAKLAAANRDMAEATGEPLMVSDEIRGNILGLGPLAEVWEPEEEPEEEVVQPAEGEEEPVEEGEEPQRKRTGPRAAAAPRIKDSPEYRRLSRAASPHRRRLEREMLLAMRAAKNAISTADAQLALRQRDALSRRKVAQAAAAKIQERVAS